MKKNAIIVVALAAALSLLAWENISSRIVDLEGQQLDLEAYPNQVVLVNFWATWCVPCRIEIPWFIEFQEKYGPRGFTVLGVAMDDEGEAIVRPYVENERFEVNGTPRAINYPILIGNAQVEQQFDGLIGLPTSVLINRKGERVKRFIGLVNHEILEQAIQESLLGPEK